MKKTLASIGISPDRVHVFDEIDSTNLEAVRRARASAPTDIEIFIARAQSAGRGRLGRSFVSERGAGIYLSISLPKSHHSGDSLTAHTAAALASMLDAAFGIKAKIKWVNDIYLSGKKLCGILVEAVTSTDGNIIGFVVGMGINVYKNAITDEISDIATSLEHEGILIDDTDELLAMIVESFISRVLTDPDGAALLSEYRMRSLVVGKEITVMPTVGEEYTATAISINDDFTLKIRLADGSIRTLASGDVKTRIKPTSY